MARARICDRCGKVINMIHEQHYRINVFLPNKLTDMKEKEILFVDICEWCKDELIEKWVNGKPCGGIVRERPVE